MQVPKLYVCIHVKRYIQKINSNSLMLYLHGICLTSIVDGRFENSLRDHSFLEIIVIILPTLLLLKALKAFLRRLRVSLRAKFTAFSTLVDYHKFFKIGDLPHSCAIFRILSWRFNSRYYGNFDIKLKRRACNYQNIKFIFR